VERPRPAGGKAVGDRAAGRPVLLGPELLSGKEERREIEEPGHSEESAIAARRVGSARAWYSSARARSIDRPRETTRNLESLRQTPSGEVELVAFDTETAMHAPLDRLVEIAAVRFRGGEKVAEFSTLVDPGCPISPEAIAIHGIDDAAVRGAPDAGK